MKNLKQLKQWVCRGDDKKVINRNGEPFWKSADLWMTLGEAIDKLKTDPACKGLGFIVTPECPYTVIDIDDCFDEG